MHKLVEVRIHVKDLKPVTGNRSRDGTFLQVSRRAAARILELSVENNISVVIRIILCVLWSREGSCYENFIFRVGFAVLKKKNYILKGVVNINISVTVVKINTSKGKREC